MPTSASTPPIRSSIRCPSIGWRSTISNSSSVRPPGLVEDRVGHVDLADVVQQRARTRGCAGRGRPAQLVADPERRGPRRRGCARRRCSRRRPRAPRHQHRRPAVGVGERERVIDPLAARGRTTRGGPSREHEAQRPGSVARERREQADGGEASVDADDPAEEPQLEAGRTPRRTIRARAAAASKATARRARGGRPASAATRGRRARGARSRPPVRPHATRRAGRRRCALRAGARARRREDGRPGSRGRRGSAWPRRREEEHGHQDQLARGCVPAPDLEARPLRDRVERHEADGTGGAQRPVRGHDERQQRNPASSSSPSRISATSSSAARVGSATLARRPGAARCRIAVVIWPWPHRRVDAGSTGLYGCRV